MATNAELLERRAKAVARGVASATPVYAARAENAEIWDVDGKRYIDFAGGIAVLNTGHRHPKVMAAAREQLERFTHTAFQVLAYEPYIALAERLNKLAPFKGAAKTVLFTTGAGRGRILCRAHPAARGAAQDLRRAWHPADLRRGAGRLRPHGQDVRHRA